MELSMVASLVAVGCLISVTRRIQCQSRGDQAKRRYGTAGRIDLRWHGRFVFLPQGKDR